MNENSMKISSKQAKTDLSADELTLHLIATGLVKLANFLEDGKSLTLPYPEPLQRGLNRLVALCLKKKQIPPQGISDLFDWCRRPIAEWPLQLPQDSYASYDTLLNGYIPTDFCEHWSYLGSDIEAELNEQHFFLSFVITCKNANAPDSYVAFRRFLIENPVLTNFDLLEKCLDPLFEKLTDQLKGAYKPAPEVHAVNGCFHCCSVCGSLLLKTAKDELVCENERCRHTKRTKPGRIVEQKEGVFWLRREIRRFITLPGLAELRLANHLTKLGIHVDLWPNFDLYDLRINFPDGEIWAVDVKDWANPFLLAQSVKPIPQNPTWTRAYFVFPNERCQRKTGSTDYLRAFKNHCRILNSYTKAACEKNFISQVKQKLEQVKHA